MQDAGLSAGPLRATWRMQLIILTSLTMIAFAGNSVLTRLAVGRGLIDPIGFALVRVVAGAAVLCVLVALRRRRFWPGWSGRLTGAAGLSIYLIGFSLAYVALGAGTGALILFGMVQITMFAGAVLGHEPVPARRWAGAMVGFAGLALLLTPGATAPDPWHAGLMAAAGIGWGIYSLAGRHQSDALAATAANFLLSVPVLVLAVALAPGGITPAPSGVALAVLSGAVTSGLGYALWYRLVPQLGAARAGLAQLTVPVLAAGAGLALLAEPVGWRFITASALVLGGVALGSAARQKR